MFEFLSYLRLPISLKSCSSYLHFFNCFKDYLLIILTAYVSPSWFKHLYTDEKLPLPIIDPKVKS